MRRDEEGGRAGLAGLGAPEAGTAGSLPCSPALIARDHLFPGHAPRSHQAGGRAPPPVILWILANCGAEAGKEREKVYSALLIDFARQAEPGEAEWRGWTLKPEAEAALRYLGILRNVAAAKEGSAA